MLKNKTEPEFKTVADAAIFAGLQNIYSWLQNLTYTVVSAQTDRHCFYVEILIIFATGIHSQGTLS